MPLPYHDSDMPEHVIRTEYKNLTSVTWWKSLGIDALILYSWGAPRYLPVARAVHRAGIRLIIHMDTGGNFEGLDWESLSFFKKIKRYFQVKLHDLFRSLHLRYADVITCGLPVSISISKRLFYGKWVQRKSVPMACPVSCFCAYDGRPKKDIIASIGRWDDIRQKRAPMLMKTLSRQ